jgi:hypothetical protein
MCDALYEAPRTLSLYFERRRPKKTKKHTKMHVGLFRSKCFLERFELDLARHIASFDPVKNLPRQQGAPSNTLKKQI